MMLKRICVYCGSRTGASPIYVETAKDFGRLLVKNKIELVYGGASVGVMGAIADAVVAAGGRAIGVLPKMLTHREIAHAKLTELFVVNTMHERKQKMFELSDAFVALPGGLGTFEEICEILTWQQLGTHRLPCGFLNINGYYNSMIDMFDRAFAEEFLGEEHRKMIIVENEAEALLTRFQNYTPPRLPFWMSENQT